MPKGTFYVRRANLSLICAKGLCLAFLLGSAPRLYAQASPSEPPVTGQVTIPGFFDSRVRPERSEPQIGRRVRVLTNDEFPPLHFMGADGTPTGFSIELIRAACERLSFVCTVQARRFDLLEEALAKGEGDVIAAAIPISATLRARFGVTKPYFRNPARFVARTERINGLTLTNPSTNAIAVVEGTAHAAFLSAYFPKAKLKPYHSLSAAQDGLKAQEADALFADGMGLSLWLNGTASNGCCAFVGGPYWDSFFFGEGIAFLTRKDDDPLRRALDEALYRLWDDGTYADLILRFFPVSFY